MCFLISSAKIAHFPRTAKQIADYFRENANETVSLPVERSVFFILQRWQAVIGPVQGYSLFGFLSVASSLKMTGRRPSLQLQMAMPGLLIQSL